jgi:hypothetical protein
VRSTYLLRKQTFAHRVQKRSNGGDATSHGPGHDTNVHHV